MNELLPSLAHNLVIHAVLMHWSPFEEIGEFSCESLHAACTLWVYPDLQNDFCASNFIVLCYI